MRLKPALCTLAVMLALFSARPSRAQLPDQRGETYIATGNLLVSGTAFGQDFSQIADGGIDIVRRNLSRLVITNAGNANNNALAGIFRFPVFPSDSGFNEPTAPNPSVSMTGSFDRDTGAFTMSGAINSVTIIDFGVTDLGAAFGGRKRIQVRLQSLAIAITGTGAITGGQFRITQVGTSPFVYPNLPNQVRLCLQDPQIITFGGLEDDVVGSSFTLREGEFFQPAVSGTITLEGIANIGATAMPVGTVFFLFNGVNGNQIRAVTLGNDGSYTTYVNPDAYTTIKAKNASWLRELLASNVNLNRNDASGINGTLLAGDSNNDNTVDIGDLTLLILAYNQVSPAGGYQIFADFNRDGANDIADLSLIIANYNKMGD